MSKIIYIVDDEPSFLKASGLLLRKLNRSWSVREFCTPTQALAAVRQKPPHLILSDYEMPQMTGTELLDQVRQVAPATVRIMVSSHVGFSDKLGSAHHYLAKLCAVRDLEGKVRQALAAQTALQNPGLARLVSSFPVLPAVYSDLIAQLQSEDSSVEGIADLLE